MMIRLVLVLVSFSLSQAALTQQQRIRDGTAYSSLFGEDVAVSGDGSTVMVGAPNAFSQLGNVYVYVKSGGTWNELEEYTSANISGDLSMAGYGVAISEDATTLAYGEPGEGAGVGIVTIRTRNVGGTYDELEVIVPSDPDGLSAFGSRLAFCNGSDVLVVSGPDDDSMVGAVWVFVLSGGSYTQATKLVGSGGSGAPRQGTSLSVTPDCSTIAIAGPNDSTSVGAVWIFVSSGSNTWSQQGSKLTGSNPSWLPKMGTGLSLSADGSRVAAGGPTNNYTGATWVFDRSGGTWSETAYIRFTTPYNYPKEGASVVLSQNGNTLRIGAPMAGPNDGLVKTYTYSAGSWTLDSTWSATTSGDSPRVGYRMVASADDSTLVIGAQYEDYNIGAAYIATA